MPIGLAIKPPDPYNALVSFLNALFKPISEHIELIVFLVLFNISPKFAIYKIYIKILLK